MNYEVHVYGRVRTIKYNIIYVRARNAEEQI